MGEGTAVEFAHSLTEHHGSHAPAQVHRLVEVLEILMLAVVAVVTAWSGYQAAQWDGRQALLYGQSNHERPSRWR